jgi:DNA-binding NarL/FixJ family response regulator
MTHATRVLVVEDQFLVAHDCEFHLRSAGIECVGLASTADEAVDIAGRKRPDLVVMDVRLADHSDGVEAAIEIFERFGIRCIFTSGHADSTTRAQAQPAHPLGWLNKPYTPEALVAEVRRAYASEHPAPH